jgi:hypothetical protein
VPTLLAGILRVVFVLIVVRLLFRGFAALVRALQGPATRPRAAAPAPAAPTAVGELVRDRVCNTFLPKERALVAEVSGAREHFCSPACRDRALAAAAPVRAVS